MGIDPLPEYSFQAVVWHLGRPGWIYPQITIDGLQLRSQLDPTVFDFTCRVFDFTSVFSFLVGPCGCWGQVWDLREMMVPPGLVTRPSCSMKQPGDSRLETLAQFFRSFSDSPRPSSVKRHKKTFCRRLLSGSPEVESSCNTKHSPNQCSFIASMDFQIFHDITEGTTACLVIVERC